MSRFSMWQVAGGVSMAVLAFAAPAAAQPADEAADSEIVVTARRFEERLQDVPISIAVFNQEQLESQNIVNPQDLATITPSLSANTFFGSEATSFAIRGFTQEMGTAPSVGVYFADVVAPRGGTNGLVGGDGAGPGSYFDLQNVQVLRGPQGTLFGRNTTGGAVLLVPHRPTDDLEGYLEAGAGDYNMRRLQGVLNLPVSENVRLRFGVDDQSRDGHLNNLSAIGPDDFGDVNYTAYRASAAIDITPDLETYFVASYSESNTNGQLQRLIASDPTVTPSGFPYNSNSPPFNGATVLLAHDQVNNPSSPNYQGTGFYDVVNNNPNPSTELTQWQVANNTAWHVNENLTVRNIISYAELQNDYVSSLYGYDFTVNGNRVVFAETNPPPGGHTSHQSTFTEEFRLEGASFSNALQWQAGLYYELSEPLSQGGAVSAQNLNCGPAQGVDPVATPYQCAAPFVAILGPVSGQGQLTFNRGENTYENQAIYAQGTYTLTDQWRLTAGVRYTWDRHENTTQSPVFLYNSAAPGNPSNTICDNPGRSTAPDCTFSLTQETEAPTWLLGVDYTPTEDILLFAKYARGYRAGVVAPTVFQPYDLVEAEQVDTYEIGAKTSFGGDLNGIFNISAFFNDFQNQQIQLPFNIGGRPSGAPFNIGGSEIYGLELETSIQPIDGLTLSLGYAYLHTEIVELNVPALLADSAPQEGDPLALAPEHKLNLTASYRLPLPDSWGDLTVGATYIYTDEQLSNYANLHAASVQGSSLAPLWEIPSSEIVNLNLNWDGAFDSPVDLLVFVTNVTDEEYYTFIPGNGPSTGFETAVTGLPRMAGVQLRYNFGAR